MNAAIVWRTLSLIPDRMIRTQSGSLFDPQAQGAAERVTHLGQFLNWLGPLREVTKDDLRIFGLLSVYGKPMSGAAIEDDADADADIDLEAEAEAEAPAEIEAPLPQPQPALEPSQPALS